MQEWRIVQRTLLQRSRLFLFFYTFVHVVRVTYISVISFLPGRGSAENTGLLLPHPSCFGRIWSPHLSAEWTDHRVEQQAISVMIWRHKLPSKRFYKPSSIWLSSVKAIMDSLGCSVCIKLLHREHLSFSRFFTTLVRWTNKIEWYANKSVTTSQYIIV